MPENSPRSGFTLLEIMITVAIIGMLALLPATNFMHSTGRAYESRAQSELRQMANATFQYVIDNDGNWPPDTNRGIPPGVEEYLGPGEWPDGPWPGSEYDWDNFTGSDGQQVYQIAIRFCQFGLPDTCMFPDEPWSESFDYYSSFFYCLQGQCRSHPGKPDLHPGYCMNCTEEEPAFE